MAQSRQHRRRRRGPAFVRQHPELQITRGCMYLLFATVGLSLVFLLSGQAVRAEMAQFLVATPHGVWSHWKLWTLVTSPLLELQLVALLFQGLMLWMFFPQLERWWGTRRFLFFVLWTSLAGTIVGTLAGLALGSAPIAGLDPFLFAGIVAYGVLFANHQVSFFGVLPMTGRQLTYGIIAFVALFIVLGHQWTRGSADAAAMLLAWGMTSGKIAPRLWYLKAKQRWIRRKLKVVGGGARPPRGDRGWMN